MEREANNTMQMEGTIKIPSGTVVGIGKLKVFHTKDFPHKMPTFCFVVAKNDDGRYIASCLHLLVDSEGDSEVEAIRKMESGCLEYLNTIFTSDKINPWDMMRELFAEPMMEEYWRAYRVIEANLSEKGVDTDMEIELKNQIERLQEELEECKKKHATPRAKVVSYRKAA